MLRKAQPTDTGKIAEILSGFIDETSWMPRLHTRAEDISFCGRMIDRGWVTVAVQNGTIAGFMARDKTEINSLFIATRTRRQGLGGLLLNNAMTQVATLRLWTFAANTKAVEFYRRHGFAENDRSDGSHNDEGLPDIRFVWKKGVLA